MIPQYYQEHQRKSRKIHICDECGNEIPIGKMYLECSGIWDNGWETYRLCEQCEKALAFAMNEMHQCDLLQDEGPELGNLWNWLLENQTLKYIQRS